MKIGILSFQSLKKRASKEEIRLKNAAREMGHISRIFRVDKCQMVYDKQNPSVFYDGKRFPFYDVLIARPAIVRNVDLSVSIVKQFQLMGIPVFNYYLAILRAKNKLRTLQMLYDEGISVPKTMVIRNLKYLNQAIKRVGGLPVILKRAYGSYGAGVVIAESKRAVTSALDMLWKGRGPSIALIQEYVKESKGKDLRIFVVGDKVVGSMMREARRGEFRSNIELGGAGRRVEPTEEEKEIAVRATKALKLDYAGVDLVRSKTGPMVLEINSNPGFKVLESVTGVDIAGEIVKYAVSFAHKKKRARAVSEAFMKKRLQKKLAATSRESLALKTSAKK